MAMFTEYQKIGRTILEEDTDLVSKFDYGEAYITGSLDKYFSLEDSDKMLPLIFGPRDTMFEQLREFGGRFSAIDTNKTTIVRINFWAY